MTAQYKRDLNRNYLILPKACSSYQIRMFCENEINGLLRGKLRRIEGEEWIYFDISSRQSLSRLYERKSMDFSDVKNLFYSWKDAISEAERYLLNPGFLSCNPEYIFCNIATKRAEWIFYPLNESVVFPEDLNLLAEFLLEKVDHKDADAVDVVYRFYRNAKDGTFLISEMIDLIESVKLRVSDPEPGDEHEEYVEEQLQIENSVSEEQPESLFERIGRLFSGFGGRKEEKEKESGFYPRDAPTGEEEMPVKSWYENSREEDSEWNETVVIGKNGEERRELKALQDGKVYSLTNLPLVVGKLKKEVDICIEDVSVSRMHAKFFEKDGQVWMEDLNSRNGCEVNEMKLEACEKVLLSPGDRIRIGEVDFIYN